MTTQDLGARLGLVLAALASEQQRPAELPALREAVAVTIAEHGDSAVWLAIAVLDGAYPDPFAVVEGRRLFRRVPPLDALRELEKRRPRGWRFGPDVEIVADRVIVDVHHTARTGLATGIQRVVRNTIRHWSEEHEIELVGWESRMRGLRRLSEAERRNALFGTDPHAARPKRPAIAIPWRSRYLLPELAIEPERVPRIAALAEFSGNATGVIGYDCVPLTTAETVAEGMGPAFSRNLTAVSRVERVAAISDAAATEYAGWKRMLAGAGVSGPDVRAIPLATEASFPEGDDDAGLDRLVTDGLPLVLCVGSHEPRKNHLTVLHGAERLWSAGHRFCLAFIGGNSWNSREFEGEVERLRAEGRPVRAISDVDDDVLRAGYRHALFTVFPSINEGFGLPIAESLALGTPVVTSDFGSMREIADGAGGLLIDPRDDDAFAAGMERLLTDADLLDRLRAEAAARRPRTWGEYAADAWEYLVESR
jgi:Glycosyltransferase